METTSTLPQTTGLTKCTPMELSSKRGTLQTRSQATKSPSSNRTARPSLCSTSFTANFWPLTSQVLNLLCSKASSLDTGSVTDAAIHANVAYVGTQNDGLLRYDIANDTWLTPWISTGINGANDVPVAVVGDILYFGIPGYGVARKDLSTNEILLPLTESSNSGGGSSTEILPSDNIYALEANGQCLVHWHLLWRR